MCVFRNQKSLFFYNTLELVHRCLRGLDIKSLKCSRQFCSGGRKKISKKSLVYLFGVAHRDGEDALGWSVPMVGRKHCIKCFHGSYVCISFDISKMGTWPWKNHRITKCCFRALRIACLNLTLHLKTCANRFFFVYLIPSLSFWQREMDTSISIVVLLRLHYF